jgi:thymidylate synthase
MNNLDKTYTALLQDILDNGVEKKDRTGTGTISVFGRQIRHKMSEGFPLLTTKKMPFKTITTELLWFLRGDTNIKYLVKQDCNIWNGDAFSNYMKEYEKYKQSQESKKAVKEREEKKITDNLNKKKDAKITKLSADTQKEIDEAGKLYANDPAKLKDAIDKIQENHKTKKDVIEDKYDPSKPQEKKGFLSRIIDKQIDKYSPPEDAARMKEMKKDYLEAFKSGNYDAVNQKYQDKGLQENVDVNDYMNGLLSNDKIDRRKGIEMMKLKMNEAGINDEQQKEYVGMMKEFKDDFNIKSFDDQLSGAYPPKDAELKDLLIDFQNVVNKNAKGRPLNLLDKELYDNIDKRLDEIKSKIDNDPTRPQNDDINKLKEYVSSIQSNVEIKDEDVMQTTKQIIDFKQIAHYFSLLIKFLATICVVIFIIVLLISFFNVFNLSIKIITNIVSIFYNKVITNNQIISYEAKNMTKCSKSNYKDDIFNILNEQATSLAVFNTIVYIIYILLGYVIIYILLVIFVNIYRYTHVLNGDLKDIDPKYQLTSVLIIIFITSFIHLLIYKFFFRQLTMAKYKDIVDYENKVDNIIKKNLQPVNKVNDEDFFDLLTDSSRRSEVDTILANKVNEIEEPTSDLAKYLFMYDLYMYFDDYGYTNDIVRDDLKNYFKIGDKEDSDRTFISFLDANERKLIKLYHEELPFYKQIPKEKLERFQKLNEKVSQDIGAINKNIIKYTGTFYPFLFACIYIIGIFLFNVLCTYILMDYILSTERDELFMPFIYTIAKKYKSLIMYFYNIFKN